MAAGVTLRTDTRVRDRVRVGRRTLAEVVTIGVDIGTTSVKAVAADGDGRVVATTRVTIRC